jgi:predicted adenylyl cyclase CyaB
MSRNIELKARLPDLESAQLAARALGAELHSIEVQCDTYFKIADGRLKLRQRWLEGRQVDSELIFYQRPNEAAAKGSDYILTRSPDGDGLRMALTRALGILVQVNKNRIVYLHDNVRIHLDAVDGLGSFLEFEAIVDADCNDAQAQSKVAQLQQHFALRADQLVRGSYSDLLLAL